MITMKNICKTYRTARRNAGFGEALLSFFHRDYDTVTALDNVSFTIEDGETVGYIGPNGAGKSTTIKILSGILTPDSGECTVDGRVPWKNRIEHVANIGVVFGQRSQLWWDVPVIDSFELLKDIYSIPPEVYRQNKDELTELLDLADSPNILFLDEPTIGLDAVSKIAVREFIVRLNRERKTTVILTTHDMQDIEAITKRIILIGKGKILLDGDISEISGSGDIDRTVAELYRAYEI